jgi:hypothetical protein
MFHPVFGASGKKPPKGAEMPQMRQHMDNPITLMRNFVRVSCYIDAEENKGLIMPFLAEEKDAPLFCLAHGSLPSDEKQLEKSSIQVAGKARSKPCGGTALFCRVRGGGLGDPLRCDVRPGEQCFPGSGRSPAL